MADFTILGDKTREAIIWKSESHKLRNAFNVRTGVTIHKGQIVVIDSDGRIAPFGPAENPLLVIGYADTDSINPAYKEGVGQGEIEVTVAVRGYGIVRGYSSEVLTAGPVTPTGNVTALADGQTEYCYWEQADITQVPTTPMYWGIALNSTGAAEELVDILIL